MANELGSWGIVTNPYVPPELGPDFTLGRCGCVTDGNGVPDNATGIDGDVYINTATNTEYYRKNGVWTVIA